MNNKTTSALTEPLNAYSFSFESINGQSFPLSQFQGKVILVVNTASQCGFTRQYEDLEKLYKNYQDKGLVIIAVPSNDFGGQEPGTNEDIQNFCKLNYGVSFPVVKKEAVTGENAHPFYQWAKKELGFGSAPKWNFHKYLINRKGELVDYYFSITRPDSRRFLQALQELM